MYGTVTISEFHDIQQQLEDAPLNLTVPLTVLWNQLEDLKELAEHIKAPLSDNQWISIAMRKLIQMKAFPEEIKKWNNLANNPKSGVVHLTPSLILTCNFSSMKPSSWFINMCIPPSWFLEVDPNIYAASSTCSS